MRRTIGAVAALMLMAGTAEAKFRWPWEKAEKGPKPAPTAQPSAATSLPQEEEFLQTFHEANLKEIALGELALKKTRDPEVREYSTMLVADHRQADATLKAHVAKMGWRLEEPKPYVTSPARLGKPLPDIATAQPPEVVKLEPLSGDSFDLEFLRTMVEGHDALLPELAAFKEQESDRAFHAELAKMFDIVKHHRMQAKQLLDQERQDVRGRD